MSTRFSRSSWAAFDDEFEFGVVCHLGAVTGMRRDELAGLQWQRVDLEAGQILVEMTVNDAGGQVVVDNFTKTRRSRWVGVDTHTARLLADLHQRMSARAKTCGVELVSDAFVLSHSPDGSAPVRPEYLTRRMRRLFQDRSPRTPLQWPRLGVQQNVPCSR